MFIILNDKAKKHHLETKKREYDATECLFSYGDRIIFIFFALHKNSKAKNIFCSTLKTKDCAHICCEA